MAKEVKRAEGEINVSELSDLLKRATRGPWRVDRSSFGVSEYLHITAHEREGLSRSKDDGDGPICSVPMEKSHLEIDKDQFGNARGESRSWKTPIKKARADACLIVAAVNALPELLRRLGYDCADGAWIIEWPADDYGPVRYWAAGKPKPVIDVNKATRFSRREDATAVMGDHAPETGCKAVEWLWTSEPDEAADA